MPDEFRGTDAFRDAYFERCQLNPDPPINVSGEGLTIRGKGALTWENSG